MRPYQRHLTLLVAVFVATISLSVLAEDAERAGAAESSQEGSSASEEKPYIPKSKRELRRMLTPIQYKVTQNEDTEPSFKNLYWDNKKEGIYKCVVCERELFSSKTKYKSGTGWPSFYKPIKESNVGYRKDWRLIYVRTEVHCSRCKAHLGHVFDDGPKPTGKRYCMNSASMKFVEASEVEDSESAAASGDSSDSAE